MNSITVVHFASAGLARVLQGAEHNLTKYQSAEIDQVFARCLELRPDVVLLDGTAALSQDLHLLLREQLESIRKRLSPQPVIVAVLSNSERLRLAGDLLFAAGSSNQGSALVDLFIAPLRFDHHIWGSLAEQWQLLIPLLRLESTRRGEAGQSLPPMNSESWATTLTDLKSIELWYRWLPRYASYLTENPLIIGDTGTGKTKLARALHALSKQKGDFVSFTPRDFSSSELLQAELFGSMPGAFTGAIDRWGLVKSAEGGSLFLDELQSIDQDLQGKLITFIEDKTYRRVGSADQTTANVRFIFAANQPMTTLRRERILREDFSYRLDRTVLELSPLKDRPRDLVGALTYALAKIQRQRPASKTIEGLEVSALDLLACFDWPGNLRQLENIAALLVEEADINDQSIISLQDTRKILSERCGFELATAQSWYTNAAIQSANIFSNRSPNSLIEASHTFERQIVFNASLAPATDSELSIGELGIPAVLSKLIRGDSNE